MAQATPLDRYTPVSFFNTTTHLTIGEGYVDGYCAADDSYSVFKVVGGNHHLHRAPAANVLVRRAA